LPKPEIEFAGFYLVLRGPEAKSTMSSDRRIPGGLRGCSNEELIEMLFLYITWK
jgi:hypothetical protein